MPWPPVGTGRPTAAASVQDSSRESDTNQEYQRYLAYAAIQEDEYTYGPGENPEEFEPEDQEDLD
jgi:hypothetical protein